MNSLIAARQSRLSTNWINGGAQFLLHLLSWIRQYLYHLLFAVGKIFWHWTVGGTSIYSLDWRCFVTLWKWFTGLAVYSLSKPPISACSHVRIKLRCTCWYDADKYTNRWHRAMVVCSVAEWIIESVYDDWEEVVKRDHTAIERSRGACDRLSSMSNQRSNAKVMMGNWINRKIVRNERTSREPASRYMGVK